MVRPPENILPLGMAYELRGSDNNSNFYKDTFTFNFSFGSGDGEGRIEYSLISKGPIAVYTGNGWYYPTEIFLGLADNQFPLVLNAAYTPQTSEALIVYGLPNPPPVRQTIIRSVPGDTVYLRNGTTEKLEPGLLYWNKSMALLQHYIARLIQGLPKNVPDFLTFSSRVQESVDMVDRSHQDETSKGLGNLSLLLLSYRPPLIDHSTNNQINDAIKRMISVSKNYPNPQESSIEREIEPLQNLIVLEWKVFLASVLDACEQKLPPTQTNQNDAHQSLIPDSIKSAREKISAL